MSKGHPLHGGPIDRDDQPDSPLDEYFSNNNDPIKVDLGEENAYRPTLEDRAIVDFCSFECFGTVHSLILLARVHMQPKW